MQPGVMGPLRALLVRFRVGLCPSNGGAWGRTWLPAAALPSSTFRRTPMPLDRGRQTPAHANGLKTTSAFAESRGYLIAGVPGRASNERPLARSWGARAYNRQTHNKKPR